MLKEALQYLVGLKENQTYDIKGQVYSDHELVRIPPYVPRTERISVTGLDSIVALVTIEHKKLKESPVFVRVDSPRKVSVFTSYDDDLERNYLYEVSCDVPEFHGGFREQSQAIIELRSRFIENDGQKYLLELLSSISKESNVTSRDNGVSQEVEARRGIALTQTVKVRPRVALRPYRTFLEVEQPESEFIVRLDDDGHIGFFEADGGMWKLSAKSNIKAYLDGRLSSLVDSGAVCVMM